MLLFIHLLLIIMMQCVCVMERNVCGFRSYSSRSHDVQLCRMPYDFAYRMILVELENTVNSVGGPGLLTTRCGKAQLRLTVGFLFLTRSSRISPEVHQDSTGTSPESHKKFATECCQNIELEHLKKGIATTQPSHIMR